LVPCYNEEASLKQTIENLKSVVPGMDFIIINDGSKNKTLQICKENNYPVINMPFNMGLTRAVQTGMRYAYINRYDLALQFDGDGQHLAEYIKIMIEAIEKNSADIVVGSRFTSNSFKNLRQIGGHFLKVAIKLVTGKKISDPTSGMRLYNRKIIKKLAFQMNYGPEPDTLVYLIKQGVKVIEVPVLMRERIAGKSYLTSLTAINYMLRMFVSIIFVHWIREKEDWD